MYYQVDWELHQAESYFLLRENDASLPDKEFQLLRLLDR